MNEFDLIAEIEIAIKNHNYQDYLNKKERALIDFLKRFELNSLLTLFSKMIIKHNIKIEKHEHDVVPLKMLLNLPFYYSSNVNIPGKEIIIDFTSEMSTFSKILKELELTYFYYPCRNRDNIILNDKELFYLNYFRTYFFYIPCLGLNYITQFISNNINLFKKYFNEPNLENIINASFALQFFNDTLYSNAFIKILQRAFSRGKFLYTYPKNLVKLICLVFKVNYKKFIEKFAFDIKKENEIKFTSFLDILSNTNNSKFMLKSKNQIFFPMNYYWTYKLYNNVLESNLITQNLPNGKNYKSNFQEAELNQLLYSFFGNNVFHNIYLKRTNKDFVEKDFIIVFNDYVISIEAKSKKSPAPLDTLDEGLNKTFESTKKTIESALKQGKEVKDSILRKKALFYDSNAVKENKLILNLNDKEPEKFIQIVAFFEEHLNIETNFEKIYKENINFWITDTHSLEFILTDAFNNDSTGNMFINYLLKRKNLYGYFNAHDGDEKAIYNLYKQFPHFFDEKYRDIGIDIII